MVVYVALAVLPAMVLLAWLYTRDRLHAEPKQAVLRLYLRGAALVLPAGLLERALLRADNHVQGGRVVATLCTAFFVAGMVEEFLKAAIVERGAIDTGLVHSRMDCLVYAGATALGFATVENILYVTSSGFSTALLRSVTAVPAHLMFGIIMGNAFANSIWGQSSRALAYVLPAIAHGTYDVFALSASWWADGLLVIYLIWLLELSMKIISRSSANAALKVG